MPEPTKINITTLLAYRDKHGYVVVEWGDQKGQLTIEEAQAHAFKILECAASIEVDEFLFEWAKKQIGASELEAARLLADFREFRAKKIQ